MIYIIFIKMMQHGCVILDKSLSSLLILVLLLTIKYMRPVSQSLNAFKIFKRKIFFYSLKFSFIIYHYFPSIH